MKIVHTIASIGAIAFVGLGAAMAVTNPEQEAYETYAAEKLSEYVKDNVCEKAPVFQEQCKSQVDNQQSEFRRIVAESTERQNFLLFSIYKTNFSLPAPLPSYEFETVGVFQSFYSYQAEKQS
ncbi:MAG: DUF4359 domain-containing protein [Coleofasciculaceae cyanobacterium SM2_3_26]|nr:DUF4359 domain-containing protein [Coleofasciculaceae cyanobacterium SM2_3_26]